MLKFCSLPKQALFHLFSFLNDSSLITSLLVCKKWYYILQDDEFWKNRLKNRFGEEISDHENAVKAIRSVLGILPIKYPDSPQKNNCGSSLPLELIFHIFSFLDDNTLLTCAQVCKEWYFLLDDSHFWKRRIKDKLQEDFPTDFTGDYLSSYFKVRPLSKFSIKNYYLARSKLERTPQNETAFFEPASTLKNYYLAKKKVKKNFYSGKYKETCLVGHEDYVTSIQITDHHIISSSMDRTIRVWGLNGKCIYILKGHQAGVVALKASNDFLVSGSWDQLVKLWDLNTGKCLKTFKGHEMGVECLDFNGKTIVSGTAGGEVIVWDVETGNYRIMRELAEGHDGDWIVNLYLFSDNVLFSRDVHGKVLIWDLKRGKRLQQLFWGNPAIGPVRCSDKESMITISNQGGKLKVFDVKDQTMHLSNVLVVPRNNMVDCLSVFGLSVNSNWAAYWSCAVCKIFDLKTRETVNSFSANGSPMALGNSHLVTCTVYLSEHLTYDKRVLRVYDFRP
jgi:WD40 repeat protein